MEKSGDSDSKRENTKSDKNQKGGWHGNKRQNRSGGAQANNFNQRKDFVKERLDSISGPMVNLQSNKDAPAKKFTGRCRLFVGNLPNSMTEEQFTAMFAEFGEVAEVFLNNGKGFGFIKLDTRENAEAARAALDFTLKDGKHIRVRFAAQGCALKVKNLSPWVSNELLEMAFSAFGEVERAVVIVDDRCNPVGEGIVEFSKKQSAQLALKRCSEECLLLTSSPKPVLVELLEHRDEEEGLPEQKLQKMHKDYFKEREIGPRLAEPGTFEYDFCNRWKKLFELEHQKRQNLKKEIEEGRRALEEQMSWAIHEFEEKSLRERLRLLEEQSNMLQRERQLQQEESMRRAEEWRLQELRLRQQEEDILRHQRFGDSQCFRSEDMLMEAKMQSNNPFGTTNQGSDIMGNSGSTGYGSQNTGAGIMPFTPMGEAMYSDRMSMGHGFMLDASSSSATPTSDGQIQSSMRDSSNGYSGNNKRRRF